MQVILCMEQEEAPRGQGWHQVTVITETRASVPQAHRVEICQEPEWAGKQLLPQSLQEAVHPDTFILDLGDTVQRQ